MEKNLEKLIAYQKTMSWLILEYNVCYFLDGDFAGKYPPIHKSWYSHVRINDSIYDERWSLFLNISNFIGLEVINEVSFDPQRASAQLVMSKLQVARKDQIDWPQDVEELFEKIITSLISKDASA